LWDVLEIFFFLTHLRWNSPHGWKSTSNLIWSHHYKQFRFGWVYWKQ
jgi:hypothetical protein